MKIIRPMSVIDASLISSNVTEADYAAYNAGTTYALGDRVILISPSSAVTITIASPGVITWVGHGQPVGTKIVFSTTGALPTGITAGAIYYITSVTADTFKISTTSGGTALNTTGTQSGTHTATAQVHEIYESLQGGNLAHYPSLAASSTWWLDVGKTNRWSMFDQSVQSQTQNTSTIDVRLQCSGRNDSAVLLNVNAATVRIIMTGGADGTVFDTTYNMVSPSGITDWYAYFFEPIVRLQDLAVTGMPIYNNAIVEVILTDTGNTALCGALILGLSKEIGGAQYGIRTGITDYSIKQQDDFGNYTILQRSFRKTADVSVYVQNTLIDQLQILLASYRATPTVYLGVDSYGSTIIYGFYKDFAININYVDYSICTLTLEGLT
jgi:hypothetical protein